MSPDNPFDNWGQYSELEALTGFHGETRRDFYGNIYGRFHGKTKGECIRGAIADWEDYVFPMPELDPSYGDTLRSMNLAAHPKYVVAYGNSLFSTLRDARLMANALMDTVEYPEEVTAFVDRIADYEMNDKAYLNCEIGFVRYVTVLLTAKCGGECIGFSGVQSAWEKGNHVGILDDFLLFL